MRDAFFKIVVEDADDEENIDRVASLISMERDDGFCRSTTDLTPCRTSLDIIEALAGIDFIPSLDDEQAEAVEKTVWTAAWTVEYAILQSVAYGL